MRAHVVAGPAGVGKTTLGRALARRTGAVLLDLDTATNALLELLFADRPGHWNDDVNRPLVRPARYAVLRDLAAEQLALGLDVVMVAPWTQEVTGGPDWDDLVAALAPTPPTVLWLVAPAEVVEARKAARGYERDTAAYVRRDTLPAVPHLVVDATLPTGEQVDLVLAH